MVIPVADDNPTRRTAVVTIALVVLNIGVFLLGPLGLSSGEGSPLQQACAQRAYFEHWGAIPAELTSNEASPTATGRAARDAVGRVGCLVIEPPYEKRPLLSALTAMFLHGGWLHLAGNMLFLVVFGNNVEDRLGRLRYLLFYLGCGAAATYAFAWSDPTSPATLVGASGAIAGVLGAYLVLFPRVAVTTLVPFLLFLPLRLPAWAVLGVWFLVQWVYSNGTGVTQTTGVAYLAHVAGFVAGAIIALLLPGGRDRRADASQRPRGPYGLP